MSGIFGCIPPPFEVDEKDPACEVCGGFLSGECGDKCLDCWSEVPTEDCDED
jgi:hypothetical protein